MQRERPLWFDEQGRPTPDPYEVLGLPWGASREDVDARYRERVREHTPEADPEGFERVSSAYRLLVDPERVVARSFAWLHPIRPADFRIPDESPAAAAPGGPPLDAELMLYALLQGLPDDAFGG